MKFYRYFVYTLYNVLSLSNFQIQCNVILCTSVYLAETAHNPVAPNTYVALTIYFAPFSLFMTFNMSSKGVGTFASQFITVRYTL